LITPSWNEYPHWIFAVKKSAPEWGEVKLVDIGANYAEFAVENGFRFIALNLLVLEVE